FLKEIFTIRKFNLLFLLLMGSGILARITSGCMDGQANNWALFFLFYEAVRWIVITVISVQKGIYNVGCRSLYWSQTFLNTRWRWNACSLSSRRYYGFRKSRNSLQPCRWHFRWYF